MPLEVRETGDEDGPWIDERTDRLFGGDFVVSRGRIHRPRELPGFVALEDGERVGLVTYSIRGGEWDKECELVTLDALVPGRGIGTSLLAAVERSARTVGCRRLWLVTTNDNLDALRFCQRRGLAIRAVHRGAIGRSRRLKPAIPAVGHFGIPITDEIELSKAL